MPDDGVRDSFSTPSQHGDSPDPQRDERGGGKVCSEGKAEQGTVPNSKRTMEGTVDGVSFGKVVGLADAAN